MVGAQQVTQRRAQEPVARRDFCGIVGGQKVSEQGPAKDSGHKNEAQSAQRFGQQAAGRAG